MPAAAAQRRPHVSWWLELVRWIVIVPAGCRFSCTHLDLIQFKHWRDVAAAADAGMNLSFPYATNQAEQQVRQPHFISIYRHTASNKE
jgi:hypothetical protein